MTGHARAGLAAGGAIALWSANATIGGLALEHLSVWRVLLCQFVGAAVAVGSVRRWRRARRPARAAVALGTVGLAGTIVLQYVAFAAAPIVAANAIAYAWPLLAAAWLAARHRGPGGSRTLALALAGFAGMVLLLADAGASGGGSRPALGYAAAAASALAMATYTLRAAAHRPGDLLLPGAVAGALVVAVPALADPTPWTPGWAVGLSALIGVGMLAAGYGLWTVAMSAPSGARLAPAAYATPLLSTLLLLATGRTVGAVGLAGCALVVGCVLGVARPPRRPARSRVTRFPGQGRGVARRRGKSPGT